MVLLIPGRRMTLLRLLASCARLTHFCRLEFGNDRYTRNRLRDHIDDDSFNRGDARLPRPHSHCFIVGARWANRARADAGWPDGQKSVSGVPCGSGAALAYPARPGYRRVRTLSAAVRVFVLQTLTAPPSSGKRRACARSPRSPVATPRDASKQGGQDRLRTLSAAARSSPHHAGAARNRRVHSSPSLYAVDHARAIHHRGQFSTGGVTRSDPSRRVPSLCH
jgi:hypothetical protein